MRLGVEAGPRAHRAIATKRSTSSSEPRRSPRCGVRNQVAPSKRSAAARAGPPVAPPASGWPGTRRVVVERAGERALRRADVGDGRVGGRRGEHLARRRDERADRHGDDDELGAGDGVGERPAASSSALAPTRLAQGRPRRRPSRTTRRDAGPLRREGDGGAEEARPDDGERADSRPGRGAPAGLCGRGPRPRSSCFITSSTAAKSRLHGALREGPGVRGGELLRGARPRARRRSAASRSPACARLTRRTSSRRRFRASSTARSSAPIWSRRRSRSSIRAVLHGSPTPPSCRALESSADT